MSMVCLCMSFSRILLLAVNGNRALTAENCGELRLLSGDEVAELRNMRG